MDSMELYLSWFGFYSNFHPGKFDFCHLFDLSAPIFNIIRNSAARPILHTVFYNQGFVILRELGLGFL